MRTLGFEHTVILCGEEDSFFATLEQRLKRVGLAVLRVPSGRDVSSRCIHSDRLAVVLNADGIDVSIVSICLNLREISPLLPLLVCTNFEIAVETVAAYESGADDLVLKSLDWTVIEAKIRRALKRADASAERYGKVDADRASDIRALCLEPAQSVPAIAASSLTRTEELLLRALLTRCGAMVGKREISQAIWGKSCVEAKTLYEHVSTLKSKLNAVGWTLANVRGKGYRLEPTFTSTNAWARRTQSAKSVARHASNSRRSNQ